jgi:hypothetical protein
MFSCKLCNIEKPMKPKSYVKRNGLCIDCYNSIIRIFSCESCNIEFNSTHNEFNKYNKALCDKCKIFL